MSEPQIDVGGFREWFPLELEMDPDEYADSVVAHFEDDRTPSDVLRLMAAGLTGLANQLKEGVDDDTLLLAAWVLLPPGGTTLEIRTVARLQAVRVRMGMTPGEMVDDLVSGSDLNQPPLVETISTASGPATSVRIRTVQASENGTDLFDTACVFWLPEGENYAVALLTLPIGDLVVASEAAQALAGLAESVKGVV